MSSGEDEDDLRERKDDLWSMDEVRGGGSSATTDTADAAVSEETSDTSPTSDTEDTPDEEPAPAASETGDASDTADTSDDVEPAQEAEGETVRQMALDAEAKGLAVRDLHNVNVYLFESVYHDMRTKFKELDTEYFETHGEDLSKNKDFFNAVFRAGLQSPQLKKELEIE